MNTDSDIVKAACTDMLQKRSKNRRHLIKKEYFDKVPANRDSLKSPVPGMPDDEWQSLTAKWNTPRHQVLCLYMCYVSILFTCSCSHIFVRMTLTTTEMCPFARKLALPTGQTEEKYNFSRGLVRGPTLHISML